MSLALSEHLPLIASAPDGIQKLRGLILELAVRGKLVTQDHTDEPANELLKEMAAERQQLESSGVYRKAKSLPAVTDEEIAFILPNGWSWVRLGQIGDWGAGATPSRSNSKYYGGGIPWFKSGELTADFISDSEESVTELALKECSLRNNKPGDVLIAMYGATIGKTSIISEAATTNQAVCACTPYNGMFNQYLLLLLKALKPNFVGQGAGGAQPNISREKIVATVAALPPLEEQHRIVAKVDEVMALCDRLESEQNDSAAAHNQLVETLLGTLTQSIDAADFEANWKRIAEHFDTLFSTDTSIDALQQCLLQLAVMGKLVSQEKGDKNAAELLKQIAAERAHSKAKNSNKNHSDQIQPETNMHPFALPTGWEWTILDQVSQKITDGEHISPKKTTGGMMLLTAKHVLGSGVSLIEPQYVAVDDGIRFRDRCDPGIGDILICSRGTIGRCCLVTIDAIFCLMGSVILVRPFKELNSAYLNYFLKSEIGQKFIRAATKGMAVNALYLKDIKNCLIPLPPFEEQYRIVAKVDELMAVCDSLKNQLAESRKQEGRLADTLIQASLKAA